MATKISRSPRAPSVDLDEALSRALVLYEREGKHAIPGELAAQHLGYSGKNNGAAVRMLASLKAFGLVLGDNKGELSVSKEVEEYRYVPDEKKKRDLLIRWLNEPKVYADLLAQYKDRLPSENALKYRLIQMGFLPQAADDCAKKFLASVSFAKYFEKVEGEQIGESDKRATEDETSAAENSPSKAQATTAPPTNFTNEDDNGRVGTSSSKGLPADTDRIVVRLSGGRKAWIEVPTPLYQKDKEILKLQIDLIFTDEME